MIHINEKEKISIDVLEEYKIVPETGLIKMGIDATKQEQTLFLFLLSEPDFYDTFSITKDIKYATDDEALTEGVKKNLFALKNSGAQILDVDDGTFENGHSFEKAIVKLKNVTLEFIFISINGLLLCATFEHNEDLITRNENIMQMIGTIKAI